MRVVNSNCLISTLGLLENGKTILVVSPINAKVVSISKSHVILETEASEQITVPIIRLGKEEQSITETYSAIGLTSSLLNPSQCL